MAGMQGAGRPLPPLDLLRGFESAARHLSFTRAAAELFLTQSAVSRQVQALEEFVGVPLFERRHKVLALTEAGQAYYRAVAAALEQVKEATRKLRESRSRHVLTVTTTVSFASLWLVPRLARFRKEHPNVDVRIAATFEVLDMEREGIDLAIRDLLVANAPPGSVFLVGEQLAAVCSPGYLREARRTKKPLAKPADIRHHVLLVFHDPKGRFAWLSWPRWLEANGLDDVSPAGTLAFDQYDQVIQAALLGQGIALGRGTLVDQYIREKKLVALFGGLQRVPRGFHAVFARNAQSRPEVQQFVEWLQRELAAERN
ncbi:MAG TPA: transcriptional regulator GcvA [Usitatibacter sp.]|nr:transcriptional regulator GcvA [Usitatibacter sp.]